MVRKRKASDLRAAFYEYSRADDASLVMRVRDNSDDVLVRLLLSACVADYAHHATASNLIDSILLRACGCLVSHRKAVLVCKSGAPDRAPPSFPSARFFSHASFAAAAAAAASAASFFCLLLAIV